MSILNSLRLWALSAAVVSVPLVQAKAEEINLTVNGMVCAFCAQGLADLARSFDPVQEAYVDMDNRLVVLAIRPGHVMTEALIQEYVNDAGYDLESFFRVDQSTSANVERLRALLGTDLPSRPSSAYLWTETLENGNTYTFARLTIYRNHLRRWNRQLANSSTPGDVLPSGAPEWWTAGLDASALQHFALQGHVGARTQAGTLVFLRIGS